jgi:two-component system, LuxR family, response regulator FixJ
VSKTSNDNMVFVIDDDLGIRQLLGAALDSAGFTTATYGSGRAFIEVAPRLTSGCILLDVRMPEMDGLEVLLELNKLGTRLPVILMSGYADTAIVVQAMKAGAADFIDKPLDIGQLLATIDYALSSKSSIQLSEITEAAKRIAMLSQREHQVLSGVVAGGTNKTIAGDLGISVRTAEIHRARMLDRLGVQSLAEAIRLAVLADL